MYGALGNAPVLSSKKPRRQEHTASWWKMDGVVKSSARGEETHPHDEQQNKPWGKSRCTPFLPSFLPFFLHSSIPSFLPSFILSSVAPPPSSPLFPHFPSFLPLALPSFQLSTLLSGHSICGPSHFNMPVYMIPMSFQFPSQQQRRQCHKEWQ